MKKKQLIIIDYEPAPESYREIHSAILERGSRSRTARQAKQEILNILTANKRFYEKKAREYRKKIRELEKVM